MKLETVSLDSTGTKVSELAFGTWRFGHENDHGAVEIGVIHARRNRPSVFDRLRTIQ